MRRPDADGFVFAAQKCVQGHEVVFLHDAEGTMVAALLPMWAYTKHVDWKRMPRHDHIEPEMGFEVPWQ